MDPITIVLLIVAIVIGLVLGFIVNRLIASSSSKNAAREAASLVEDAKKQAETLRREAAVSQSVFPVLYVVERNKTHTEKHIRDAHEHRTVKLLPLRPGREPYDRRVVEPEPVCRVNPAADSRCHTPILKNAELEHCRVVRQLSEIQKMP